MAKNLNDKSSEYIEANILSESPEGLPPLKEIPAIVISNKIPDMRAIVFINGRDPGQELMFHYHSATHPLKHYTLFHGQEYTLPVEIIDHLETRGRKQYGYKTNPHSGHPEMYCKGYDYHFRCQNAKTRAA